MIEHNFTTAFERVSQLVADFRQHEREYLTPSYSEQDVRKDFIDKFWIALGWDVNHEYQKNPNEREVKVESNVKVEGRRKKADYAFLAQNFRDVRFFVEAKKPARDIDNADDYFQTIRYGWNAQAPLSVLTDFEQFRVLDCRYKPDIQTALNRAIPKLKFHYTDYADEQKFAEIYYLFSREAVIGGKLEGFADTLPKPTGKAAQRKLFGGAYKSVDEDFLQELDELREELARSFKNRNPHLNGEDLTEATQRTLDRLVFMRFLEDKLIEPEAIVERLGERGTAWADFVAESERLNRIYNGIIFKHHFIDKSDFIVDERVFTSLRERLSHKNTPYDFNSLPVHILGSIYERFLGKVIVATDKRARVEEKPEVRKAGGVYYTPEYIVRYIVEQTIGKLIADKTPEEIAEMCFADIACGSGSFLLGVYDELLRHHTAYYNAPKNRRKAMKAGSTENADGTIHLSLNQRKDILLNNIYGVDLDAQAVEVAQLSLFLKLLEDETTASARGFQLQFRETMLPSLDKNIVHGNSLIGWDISRGLFGDEEERKLFPMDFEQAFPEVMRRGGFDAIVGNPPWGAEFPLKARSYLVKRYPRVPTKTKDSYFYFIYKALELLKADGTLGFIVPNTWLLINNAADVRKNILSYDVVEILDHGDGVFKQATVESCTMILNNTQGKETECHAVRYRKGALIIDHLVRKEIWLADNLCRIILDIDNKTFRLLNKIRQNSVIFEEECKIIWGIKPYQVGYGDPPQTQEILEKRIFHATTKLGEEWKPLLVGSDVNRYSLIFADNLFIKYGKWLMYPSNERLMLQPKILLRQTSDILRACYDEQKFYCQNSLFIVHSESMNLKYLLGLLNSKLLGFVYKLGNPQTAKVFAEIKPSVIKQLPIHIINFSDKADRERHDRMVNLVDQMLTAKRALQHARTDRDKHFYETKCAALDRQIDNLVYELYELTPAEMALIEASG